MLLPLALLIAGIALALFIWAVRSGQFDDMETPAVRILFDDEAPAPVPNGTKRSEGPSSQGQNGTKREGNSSSANDGSGIDKEGT